MGIKAILNSVGIIPKKNQIHFFPIIYPIKEDPVEIYFFPHPLHKNKMINYFSRYYEFVISYELTLTISLIYQLVLFFKINYWCCKH